MDTRQVEITEMDVRIRNAYQPITQIGRPGIARYKQHFPPIKQVLLPTDMAEVLSILNTDHHDIRRYAEHVRLLNEKSDTVRWSNKESLIPHPRLNRFVTVHKESAKGSQLDGLGISCFLHKHTAFQRCMLAIGNFQPSFKRRTGSVSIANELTTDIHIGQAVRDTTSVCNRNQ